MRKISILDCTLRDGGFVNDWNFGMGSMKSIIGRLDKAGIDMVEIGFLDSRRQFDPNRSIQPDTTSFRPLMENVGLKNSMIFAMIDFGTCGIEAIEPRSATRIDGIRVIFKKKEYKEALQFCSLLKAKGYMISVNPVSVTSYSDDEMSGLLDDVNALEPYTISVVDTYGLMHKKQLVHYFELMDKKLKKSINIGYHSHNNFQLAYANCVELIEHVSERNLILDGSLYGMGKGAGNANSELLAMYLNRYGAAKYDANQLLEAIDVDIMKEYEKKYWGYSLMHYIAASNDCHPDFVKTLIAKKTLSVKSINEILPKIDAKIRLTFNKDLIEKMYEEYQNVKVDDAEAYEKFAVELKGRNILLLAPGGSIIRDKGRIDACIRDKKALVVAVNFVTDKYRPDVLFFGNAKRYSQFFDEVLKLAPPAKVVCTSNVSEANKSIDYLFNFNSLISKEEAVRDNPMLMMLKMLVKMKVENVMLAGFDGYTETNSENYYDDYMKYLYCADNVMLRNELIRSKVKELSAVIKMEFITPTAYL